TAQESNIDKLQEELAALTLELRNERQDLLDAEKDLESTQVDLDTALSNLAERDLELENTKAALSNSDHARQEAKAKLDKELSAHAETKLELQNIKDALVNSERARQEANRNRLQTPQPRFRIFTMQRQTVDRILKQFIADNANLDPIELKNLRFDPSPKGENVIQHMRRDKDAPIKLTNRSFVLRGDNNTEPEMIEYITKVFNTYTKDSPAAAANLESD
ncbi:hypothetical protein BGZ49_010564, partial [Haplosporangium sp. Z 27]